MFENCGKKIRTVSIVLFWISATASIVLAFVVGKASPISFFAMLIGYPLLAYISTLFLVAFGDMTQNIQHIKDVYEQSTVKTNCKEEEKRENTEE